MSVIEKDEENLNTIEELYLFDAILFENTVLIIDDIEYSICYVAFEKIYDIVMQDRKHTHIISYEETKELTPLQQEYFNMLQGETKTDEHGNKVKCVSHSIEYVF